MAYGMLGGDGVSGMFIPWLTMHGDYVMRVGAWVGSDRRVDRITWIGSARGSDRLECAYARLFARLACGMWDSTGMV